ncbi:zinc ribbon domain-containing protein [Lacticaseibacillus sp. GG6-2]
MKKCPQCGAMVAADAKFCTSCGYAFPAVEAQPEPAAAQPQQPTPQPQPNSSQQAGGINVPPMPNLNAAQAKAAGRNYWQYFVDSLIHPLRFDKTNNPYFGLVSLAILAVISTISMWRTLATFGSSMVRLVVSLSDTMSGGSAGSASNIAADVAEGLAEKETVRFNAAMGQISGGTCLKFFFAFVVVVMLYVALAFAIRRFISHDTQGFLNMTTDFGRFFSPMIVVALVILVLGFNGFASTMKVLIVLLILNSLIFNVGFIAVAIHNRQEGAFDVTFAIVIVELVMALITMWLTKTIAISSIQGLMSQLGADYEDDILPLTRWMQYFKFF